MWWKCQLDYLVEYPNEISGFNENYRLIKI